MSPSARLRHAVLAAVAAPLVAAAPATAQRPPNVLLVIADDLGVDQLASYGVGSDLPITPTLDGLAAGGVLFRNAWSSPNCSPTRAGILTGRHAFRTGIGDAISQSTSSLPLGEFVVPEMLDEGGAGYAHALFGKWHLGSSETVGGSLAPNVAGFDHFDGSLQGALQNPPPGSSYFHWPQVVNGVRSWSTTYATTAAVDSALAWIQGQTEPWLCVVSFNAPHLPFHEPPAGLYYEDLTGLLVTTTPRPFYKAMIEALDTELARLLAGLGPAIESTVVVFVGDNGTPQSVTVPPFVPTHAKATVYEGGVNVPLVVAGPGVAIGAECAALVQTLDLYATIGELAGVDVRAVGTGVPLDAISLVPHLVDPTLPSLRTTLYTERFQPVGSLGWVQRAHRAIRGPRYKLVSKIEGYELYDLAQDPFESVNLIPLGLDPDQEAAFLDLEATMIALVNGA